MKKSNIVLALASAMLLASCDNTPKPEGNSIAKEEAAKKISDASKSDSSSSSKAMNLTYTYTETDTENGKTETDKREFKASVDDEKNQYYFHLSDDDKTTKFWAYKDGEKYFSASESGENKTKTEVSAALFKASFATFSAQVSTTISASFGEASLKLSTAISETSLSVEGVKKNDIVTTSKGEGHVYFSWNFESGVKDGDKTSSTKIEYYFVMENNRPTRELLRSEIVRGDETQKIESDLTIEWNKAAYPGNPNF